MQLGIVGHNDLAIATHDRFVASGIEVVSYECTNAITSLQDLEMFRKKMTVPRIIWIFLPDGQNRTNVLGDFADKLDAGDLVIDVSECGLRATTAIATNFSCRYVGYLEVDVDCGQYQVGETSGTAFVYGSSDYFEVALEGLEIMSSPARPIHISDRVGSGHPENLVPATLGAWPGMPEVLGSLSWLRQCPKQDDDIKW